MKKGFTLIEILIVLAIFVLILGLAISSFNLLLRIQALNQDQTGIGSLLEQAKSLSVNSKSASSYGVYFSTTTATLFKGTNYSVGETNNIVYSLNNRVHISDLVLVGEHSDQIVFKRLTGYTDTSGDIILSLKGDSSSSKLIRVYKTGLIEYE